MQMHTIALVISITLSKKKFTDYCKPHSLNYIQKYTRHFVLQPPNECVHSERERERVISKKSYLNILYPKYNLKYNFIL